MKRTDRIIATTAKALGGYMKPITPPDHFNYIGVFLTLHCNLKCPYCINHHGNDLHRPKQLTGEQWIAGLSRIQAATDLPLTLQGGEPTLHKDFFQIVNSLQPGTLDLMTNLELDVDEFMEHIPPEVFKRDAKYASIRASYHYGQNNLLELIQKVSRLQDSGYSIGIWEIDHPDYHNIVLKRKDFAEAYNIDYRIKEFLGPWKGVNYGTMRYDGAVNGSGTRTCDCRTSELIINPSGDIFRCHADLYSGHGAIGNILSDRLPALGTWRECKRYGQCNPCDIKITTNRFQEYGHSSVEIKNIKRTLTSSDSTRT
jgi:MoaA/NifB/PqqE/SkfB family radical SAM enzyme